MSEQTINRVVAERKAGGRPGAARATGGRPRVLPARGVHHANRTPGGPRGRLTECDVLALGAEARRAARYLRRGRGVVIQGRLEKARWEAGEGSEREGTCVVAERVQFPGSAAARRRGAGPRGGIQRGGVGGKRGPARARVTACVPSPRGGPTHTRRSRVRAPPPTATRHDSQLFSTRSASW